MRAVLVDQVQPGPVLGHDVGQPDLPQGPQPPAGRARRPAGAGGRGRGLHQPSRARPGRAGRRLLPLRLPPPGARARALRRGRCSAHGGRAEGRDGGELGEGPAQGPAQHGEHQALVAEAHLALGGVHVDVQVVRGDGEVDRRQGVAPAGQEGVVGLLHGVGQHLAAHQAPVDGEGAVEAGVAVLRRPGAVAPDARPVLLQLREGQHVSRHRGAVDGPDGVSQAAVARRLQRQAPVHLHPKAHPGGGEGQVLTELHDVAPLPHRGALEGLPGGDVIEEVADGHAGPRGGPRRAPPAHLAPLHAHRPGGRQGGRAAGQLQVGDRGDAGQGLAPEAQGAHAVQVVERLQLARGVAQHGQLQLLGGDPAAVVADADQAQPATLNLHPHRRRPGVQGVLHQLLDHRRRAFHHLPGGDLGHQVRGQEANGGGRRRVSARGFAGLRGWQGKW